VQLLERLIVTHGDRPHDGLPHLWRGAPEIAGIEVTTPTTATVPRRLPNGNVRVRPGSGCLGYDPLMSGIEIIFAVDESPEGGYEARALGHSIFTQADSLEELRVMVRDAVSCHFDDNERPSVIRLHLVRDELLAS
jgi:hypothetical protein